MTRELESLRSEKEALSFVGGGGGGPGGRGRSRGYSSSSGSGFSAAGSDGGEEFSADGKRRRRRRKRRGDRVRDGGAYSETTASRLRDLEDELRRLREENKRQC
jgi:hypothetical protein